MKKQFLGLAIIFCVLMATASYAGTGQNQVRSFVYKWFSLFDRNAPASEFLRHLPHHNFKMNFPEKKITNHSDFKAWYKNILATVKSANHEIKHLNIIQEKDSSYLVELVVLWRAVSTDGKALSFDAFQTWKVELTKANLPIIKEYLVSDGKGYSNKTRLKLMVQKKPVFGGFITIANHKIIENMALAGKLDFVWLEAEHTEFDPEIVQNLTIAAENENLTSIVRVPENDFNSIKKYIGTGVQGVIVPSIKTAADAERAIKALKYAPAGDRAAGVERGNRYLGRFKEYKNSANHEILAILMVETKEAVDNIEEIVKVPGIDVLHMGPYDLSLSYGVEMSSEKLKLAIKKVELIAKKYGIPLGSYAPTMDAAKAKMEKGYRFFTIPGDMEFIQTGVKSFFE